MLDVAFPQIRNSLRVYFRIHNKRRCDSPVPIKRLGQSNKLAPFQVNRIVKITGEMSVAISHSQGESVADGKLFRLAAFSTDPNGGNPAGVWIGKRNQTNLRCSG